MADPVLPVDDGPPDLRALFSQAGNSAPVLDTASPPAALEGPPDLKALFGQTAAPQAAPKDEGRGLVRTMLDPTDSIGAAGELAKGVVRGVRGAGAAGAKLVGADETAEAWSQTPQSLEAEVPSFRDIRSPNDATKYVYALLGQSAPEMAAVIGAGVGGSAVGGPAGGLAAAYATSTAFNTGRNLQRQFEETGEESFGRAFGAALVQAAPDVLVPGRVGQFLPDRLAGIAQDVATKPGREVAIDVATESATEAFQQGIEIAQADPELGRIMFDPQTPEEMAKADELWEEIIESAVGGGAAGGTISGGTQLVRARKAAQSAEPTDAPTAPSEPAQQPAQPQQGDVADGSYYDRLERRESGGRTDAEAPGSSATGLHQFVDATWMAMVKKHRPDLLQGRSEEAVLELRKDKAISREIVRHFTRDNAANLQAAGIPVTQASLYAAHHFGTGGARKLFNAAPNAKVVDVLGADVVKANPYLKGKTVAWAIANIQKDFGDGGVDLTPPMPAIATVKTASDRSGIPLAQAEPVRQRDALVEGFRQEFETVLDKEAMTGKIAERLDRILMPDTGGSTPLQAMRNVASGTTHVADMTLSESMAVGQATMEKFGYGKLKSGADLKTARLNFQPREIDMAAAKPVEVARAQFDAENKSSFAHSPFAEKLVPDTLDLMATVAERMVGRADNDVGLGVRGAEKIPAKSRRRTAAADIRKMNDALRSAVDGKPVQNYERDVVRGMEALKLIDATVATEFEQMLRTYVPRTSLTATHRRGMTPVSRHARAFRDRAGVLARVPKLQYDYAAAATKGGKVKRARIYSDAVSQRLTREQVLANERYTNMLRTERKARAKESINRADQRDTEARTANTRELGEDAQAQIDAYVASLEKPAQGTPGRTGEDFVRALVPPEPPKGVIRTREPNRMLMRMMTLRQIGTSHDRNLAKVRVGRGLRNVADAARLAWEAGDKEGRAVMVRADDIGRRMSNLSGGAKAIRELGAVMNDATTYEVSMFADPKTSIPMDDKAFAESLKPADPDDPNSKAGINAHIPDARHEKVWEIHRRFMAMDNEQRGLYKETRDFYARSWNYTRDLLVRQVAQQHLGHNTDIRTAADATKKMATLSDAAQADLKAIMGLSRLRGDYFKLDREAGNWGVHAEETRTITGKDRAEAKRNLKAAMDADPTLQDLGEEVVEGGRIGYKTRREFYKTFNRQKDAALAQEKLARGDTGSDFKPDIVSNPSLRSEKLWNHGGVSPEVMARLSELSRRSNDPAVTDALNSILATTNRAMVRIERSNALGASENPADIIRAAGIRSALQVRQLHSGTEVKRVRAEAEAKITDWRKQPHNAQKSTTTQQVLNHLNELEASRNASFDASVLREFKRHASAGSVVWYLSSVSYFMLNLAQPIVYGAPFMGARYGGGGIKELAANNARLMARLVPSGVKTTLTSDTQKLQSDMDDFKDVELRDPANPTQSLNGRETTTFDPVTGDRVYLNNTRSEYREFENGEIDLAHLQFLSETRKQGAFGSTFYEAPDEFTRVDDPAPLDRTELLETGAAEVGRGAKVALDWLVQRTSSMAEHIEYVNRRSVVDAVYKMEKKKNPEAPMTAERIAEIANIADELTYQINVDYSAANRSAMHQTAGPLLLFTSFGFHFAYQTWRSFRAAFLSRGKGTSEFSAKQGSGVFLGLMGIHMALSGVQAGVPQWMQPFVTGLPALVDMGRELFGWDDENEEDELDRMRQLGFWNYAKAWMREEYGDTAADVLFNGVPAAAINVDLSGRMNLNELYTFVDVASLTQGEDQFKDVMFGLMGPVPGIGATILRNAEKMRAEGFSIPSLIEAASPIKVGRDLAKSYKLGTDGLRDRSGKVLLDADQMGMIERVWAATTQATGFAPEQVSSVYRKRDIDYNVKNSIQQERDMIYTRYRRAESTQDRREADQLRRSFNRRYPEFQITAEQLRTSRKSTRESERDFARTGGVSREKRTVLDAVQSVEGEP